MGRSECTDASYPAPSWPSGTSSLLSSLPPPHSFEEALGWASILVLPSRSSPLNTFLRRPTFPLDAGDGRGHPQSLQEENRPSPSEAQEWGHCRLLLAFHI